MNTRGIRIRPAEPDDLGAVAEIYRHYVSDTVVTFEQTPPDADEWARRFHGIVELGLPFLIAESGDGILGYAYATRWRSRPAYAHTAEESVYVAPGATGRGVGRALLAELLEHCAGAGIREVIAVVADTGDPASLELHRRCGFADAGRLCRVGHKHGRWLDTVLLQRKLA